jgi:hypothetical protein
MEKNRKNKTSIDIPMETVLVEFTKLFTNDNITVSNQDNGITREQQDKIDSDVNDYQATINNTFIPHGVNKIILKKIIKDLKNNKSKGHHKIQNELIKYGNNDKIIDLITILIKHMFENGFMPENFNIGRITPILRV